MTLNPKKVTILTGLIADEIRASYVQAFINLDSEYYINNIKKLNSFSDGLCYTGYLWDCFKFFQIKAESFCKTFLDSKRNLYVLWDIHSKDRIFIKDYWKFPKSAVLLLNSWEEEKYIALPEDIYIFDETFSWSIAFTHEDDQNGQRFCYFAAADSSRTGVTGQGTALCPD